MTCNSYAQRAFYLTVGWACLLFVSGGSRAEPPLLTLDAAIEIAYRKDPRAAAQQARQRVATARYHEMKLGYAPDVLIGVAYTDGFPGSGSNLRLRGMLGSPFFQHYAAGVDASWELSDLLRTYQSVAAARAQREAESALQRATLRETALGVIDYFERVLTVQAQVALLQEEVLVRQAEIAALRARVEAGIVPRTELLQLAAARQELEADLESARAEEHSTRAGLHALTSDARALSGVLTLTRSQDQAQPEAGEAIAEIQAARALRVQVTALQKQRSLEAIPRLTVGVSAGYANPPPGAAPGYYAAGVGLSIPLSTILRERAHREAEAALVESRAADLDARVQTLVIRAEELDSAIGGLGAARVAAAQSTLAAQDSLDALLARAAAGTVRQIEVEAVRSMLRRAQTRERTLQIRLDALRARRFYLWT